MKLLFNTNTSSCFKWKNNQTQAWTFKGSRDRNSILQVSTTWTRGRHILWLLYGNQDGSPYNVYKDTLRFVGEWSIRFGHKHITRRQQWVISCGLNLAVDPLWFAPFSRSTEWLWCCWSRSSIIDQPSKLEEQSLCQSYRSTFASLSFYWIHPDIRMQKLTHLDFPPAILSFHVELSSLLWHIGQRSFSSSERVFAESLDCFIVGHLNQSVTQRLLSLSRVL